MPRALIVDDNAEERRIIELYLGARGVAFDVAASAREGRERVLSGEYAFIFLDLDLGAGILDGEGFLAWLERQRRELPVVIISEAASLPAVIRLEQAYRHLVKFRMSHRDLQHLGDLVDDLMDALEERKRAPREAGSAGRPQVWAEVWPWLLALVVVIGVVGAIGTFVPGPGLGAVVVVGLLLFVALGVMVLRRSGGLSERSFTGVIRDLLGALSRRQK